MLYRGDLPMSYTAGLSFSKEKVGSSEGAGKEERSLLMSLYYCRLFTLKRDCRTLLDGETVLEKEK